MATVFISYSHKDEALRDQLEVHLSMLKRQDLIQAWHDRKITAGDELDPAISEKLERAQVVLLLVSPDFLASDYCYDVEMQRAMQRHEEGTARVIPIVLRPCDWQHGTPFSKLLAAPRDGKPITKWPDRDEAFLDVVTQIRNALPKPDAPSHPTSPANPAADVLAVNTEPRSSNLRLKKIFTQADQDQFQDETFEFIERFF